MLSNIGNSLKKNKKTMKENIIQVPQGFKAELMGDGNILLVKVETELPKTWEECIKIVGRNNTHYITTDSRILTSDTNNCPRPVIKNTLPSVSLAKAMLALSQLLICREVYRDGWVPDWGDKSQYKYYIRCLCKNIDVGRCGSINYTLSFQTEEIRDKFLDNFKNLIEEAKELTS